MPFPRDRRYEGALEHWIWHFLERSEGRAFVLFTSYKTLSNLAERMETQLRQRYSFFAQGQGLSRNRLLNEFKNAKDGVLFGTDSFWTVVDVPGGSSSNVFFNRLPFTFHIHRPIQSRLVTIQPTSVNPPTPPYQHVPH